MSVPNHMNIRVVKPGGGQSTVRGKLLTMDMVIKWINRQEIEPEAKEIMIKRVSRYPEGALQRFIKNAPKHLAEAKVTIRRKQEDRLPEPLEDDPPLLKDDKNEA